MAYVEFAPAKVNLTLRVLGRRTDGYHEIDSLVVFADVGDALSLVPGPSLGLDVEGPGAAAIVGENIVVRTARMAAESRPGLRLGRFMLRKVLPVAAGIGGGSSNAAAALRLVAAANPDAIDAVTLAGIAARIGADVPVCLSARLSRMRGLGERVERLPAIAPLAAVLVNPGVPLATRQVFAALAAPSLLCQPPDTLAGTDRPAILATVAEGGNDLEPTARRLLPVIGDVLAALAQGSECRIARMSGSGPTCYGLYGSMVSAAAAARRIAVAQPLWWVRATALH